MLYASYLVYNSTNGSCTCSIAAFWTLCISFLFIYSILIITFLQMLLVPKKVNNQL